VSPFGETDGRCQATTEIAPSIFPWPPHCLYMRAQQGKGSLILILALEGAAFRIACGRQVRENVGASLTLTDTVCESTKELVTTLTLLRKRNRRPVLRWRHPRLNDDATPLKEVGTGGVP